MTTQDLATWLTRIWDEQEEIATEADGESYYLDDGAATGRFLEQVTPATVLADIAAKRAILALHQPKRPADTWWWLERKCAGCGSRWHDNTPLGTPPTVIGPERGCPTVRLLALAYADRPGYDEIWRP